MLRWLQQVLLQIVLCEFATISLGRHLWLSGSVCGYLNGNIDLTGQPNDPTLLHPYKYFIYF